MTAPQKRPDREPGDESERVLRLWDTDRHEEAPDEDVEASDQIVDALLDVSRDPAAYLHWPFPTLDTLVGGMAPGELHYVCAFSSGGKTTFLSSATNRWLDQGKRVYVMPLETQPKKFRTTLACQRLGIAPGDAFSGELRRRNGAELEQLRDAIKEQIHRSDALRVKGTPEITATHFGQACEEAADWRADVVIIDHIDHIAAGDGSNLYAESVKVNREALRHAQRFGLVLVLASQLNNEAARGDHLARYQAPRESFVQMGAHKRQVASGMIGLYRPLRARRSDEDAKRHQQLIAMAAKGTIPPHDLIQPNTMAIVQMKSRSYGNREWQRVTLRVEQGRVVDVAEQPKDIEDRYDL